MEPARPHSPLRPVSSSGNAFVYVLIACVLFGMLSYVISRNGDSTSGAQQVGDDRAIVAANSIIAYAAAAQTAIVQMDRGGVVASQIDFIIPSNAAFNTAPNERKLFHPEGGGLNYKLPPAFALDSTYSSGNPTPGYYIGRFNNIEWTPTTANDVIFTAWGLNQQTCAALNKQTIGVSTIPNEVNLNQMRRTLVDVTYHSSANADATAAACPTCNEKPALCMRSSGTPYVYAFYQILVPR